MRPQLNSATLGGRREVSLTALTILPLLLLVVCFIAWHILRAAGLVDMNRPARELAVADAHPDLKQIGPAAQLTPSWRGNPFHVCHRYRVLVPLPPPSSQELSPGYSVTYQGSGYSRYDGASIHYFLTESGESREWWLYDDDPAEQSQTLFGPAE